MFSADILGLHRQLTADLCIRMLREVIMKKNIVKYTEDVAELLRQKDKYHLGDDVYEKRLREAKLSCQKNI